MTSCLMQTLVEFVYVVINIVPVLKIEKRYVVSVAICSTCCIKFLYKACTKVVA